MSPSRSATFLALFLVPAALSAQAAAPAPAALELAVAAAPVLVGPGRVSTELMDFSPALAPDGRTLYFVVTDAAFTRMTIVQSERRGRDWSAPVVAPFSGRWNDGDLALAPDGQRVVFMTNRPVEGTMPKADFDLWTAERRADGSWSDPVRLPDAINSDANEVYPSLAADGTLYFGRNRTIYRTPLVNGRYGTPEPLPMRAFSFAIAPDQSFAVFGAPGTSPADMDLHIVLRQGDGWSAPLRFGAPVNSPAADLAGSISPDGTTLYFVSTRRSAPVAWPRRTPPRTLAELRRELATVDNGLRNIWAVPVGPLLDAARDRDPVIGGAGGRP